MKINQKKVDKISYGLGIKYLWWFLEDYKILGEKNLEKITEKKNSLLAKSCKPL